jgi:hypothetical protein
MRQAMLILAVLAGCAAPAVEPAPAPTAESLSFDSNSWGKPLSAWTVERSGRGRYTASKDASSGHFHEYDLVTRSFPVSPEDYRRIEALLRPAHAYAGESLPCELTLTDAVYGKVRWGGPAGARQVDFNLGCTSKKVGPIYDGLWQADQLVERLAAAGTVVETREIREPRP